MEKRLKKEQKADTAKRRQKRAEKNKRRSQQKKKNKKIGKLLMRNKTTLMRVTLRGPFNVPNKNMKN